MKSQVVHDTRTEIVGPALYGVMAEFADAEELVAAARKAYREGYRKMDAYSPYPIEGLAEALGSRRTLVPIIMLLGGLLGCAGGYLMQYYLMAIDLPINVGGRPLNSWPMYIPVTFELTILISALVGAFGMLALNGLPMPYHPVFNVPDFARASHDRFFLVIESRDPKYSHRGTRRFLESLMPREVCDVPE